MVDIWVELVILAVLIGLSGFFSGLEVALVNIRKSKVVQLFNEKKKGSKALYKLKMNPSWMMSSVNLGNNLVNVGASALATSLAIRLYGNDGLGIAVGVMTFLILVFGEITPKTYCNANSTKIALRYAPVLLAFSYVFFPVVKFFEIVAKGVVKLTGSSNIPPPITEEEIKGVIDQGLEEKALEKDVELPDDAFDEFNSLLELARDALEAGDFKKAEELAEEADDVLEDVEDLVKSLEDESEEGDDGDDDNGGDGNNEEESNEDEN